MDRLEDLLVDLRSCRVCAEHLPLGPRPVVQASSSARLLVASQAPGSKVHQSGIPFSDDSGWRLRNWMGIDEETFYDARRVAIVPMGFCYPGKAKSGDAPPRRECARLWRPRLLGTLTNLQLTLLVGSYAQDAVLGVGRMTERVQNFRAYLPKYFPLPHPSWRSRIWADRNPWFEEDVLPVLQSQVARVLSER